MNNNLPEEDKKLRLMDMLNPKLLFSYGNIMKNLPFLMFLFLLAIFYIWNGHKGEKHQKELNIIQEELVEYEWEFNTTTSELNNISMQSEVAKMVNSLQLVELDEPPNKIRVEEK